MVSLCQQCSFPSPAVPIPLFMKLKIHFYEIQTFRRRAPTRGRRQSQTGHYMTQPLVELYGGCMVVLKVS